MNSKGKFTKAHIEMSSKQRLLQMDRLQSLEYQIREQVDSFPDEVLSMSIRDMMLNP